MKVLVLGYYNRKNIGDDMFSFIFRKYFEKHWPEATLMIKNTDDLEVIPADVNVVVCGGGDLINNYFMNKINHLIQPIKDIIPVYAVGVGIPYPNLIEEGALDCFDFIIHRNKPDQARLLNKYGSSRVQYCPDLGFLLPNYSSKGISSLGFRELATKTSAKKIGVFLSKTIYHQNNPQAYEQILDSMAYFLVKLSRAKQKTKIFGIKSKCIEERSSFKYLIYLIPCCTGESDREDDRQINRDLMVKIKNYGNISNIKLIEHKLEIGEVIPVFREFHFTICTRFHAHIFSILANTPIISIYSSRKVENLLTATNIQNYGIKMETDPTHLFPVKLDCWPLFEKYNLLTTNYQQYYNQLKIIHDTNRKEMKRFTSYFNNLIWTPIKYLGPESGAFHLQVNKTTREIATMIVNYFLKLDQNQATKENYIAQLSSDDPENYLKICDFINMNDQTANLEQVQRFLTELISYQITGVRVSDFNYGLKEQVLTPEYHLYESIKWMLSVFNQTVTHERILSNPVMISYRKFNMKYFKQHDLQGFHRSGWAYVVNNLENFHNPNGPIFDSFLDKTFGWNYDFYRHVGKIPFQKAWVGVFHHTPDENYSINNLVEVFRKPLFLQSLVHCRGIYVLSNYLKIWIKNRLNELNYQNLPVNVLIHPTEKVNNCFTFKKFTENEHKKVIQIGAWLRNSYAIYQLPNPKHLTKCALKGKDMDNYYLDSERLQQVKDAILDVGHQQKDQGYRPHGPICRPGENVCNKYLVGLVQMIDSNHQSVQVIDFLTNEEYDKILSQNIVFINLVDASAVNTVIECIIRATPIVVNRLPAIEEYLGVDYPLYYDNLLEAQEILNDFDKLKAGHQYLANLDSDRFNINYFLGQFLQSQIYRSL